MRRFIFGLLTVVLMVVLLLIWLPTPVTPGSASPSQPRPASSVVSAQPIATVAPAATGFVTAVPPQAAVGITPTTEPPHVVVVAPTAPQAEPPQSPAQQQGSASLEVARLLRADLRLWTEYGLIVNTTTYGVYSVRDANGNVHDPSPFERMTISWVTANER